MSQKKRKLIKKIIEVKESIKESFGHSEGIVEILRNNWKILLLICFGAFLVFFNSLNANFVSDDYASITTNPTISDSGLMLGAANSTSISRYIIYGVFGNTSPVAYHVFNLIILMLVTILGYVVAYKLFGSAVALISASLFAVHPIHVEAVTWISGVPYLFIAFYVLLSFLMMIRFRETGNKLFLLFGTIFFLLGFFTDNPRPFSIFPILFLYYVLVDFKGVEKLAKYIPIALGIIVVVLIIAWPHILHRIEAVNGGYNASESLFYNPLFQYPTGLSKYFQLLLFPADLTLYHTMYVFPVWLNWCILLSYLTTVIYFLFKDKRIFFALSFIFAAVLPSIMPIKVSWLVAERYMFLGSLGFCLFLGIIIDDLSRRVKYLMPVVVVVLLCGYSVRTFFRNIDWQTNHNLWVNTCQVSPNSHNAWNNIGDDYDKLKQMENAVKGFTQSTIVKPNYADAYHNRANIFFKMNRIDLARASYETALYYSPTLYQTYLSLINLDLIEKNMDLALTHAQKSVTLQPNNPSANYVLAVVYSQRGELEKAKEVLTGILKVYPEFKQAADALAQINAAVKQ